MAKVAKVECKARVAHGNTKFQPGDVIQDMSLERAEALVKSGFVVILEVVEHVIEDIKDIAEDVVEDVKEFIDGDDEENVEEQPAETDVKPVKKSRFNRGK